MGYASVIVNLVNSMGLGLPCKQISGQIHQFQIICIKLAEMGRGTLNGGNIIPCWDARLGRKEEAHWAQAFITPLPTCRHHVTSHLPFPCWEESLNQWIEENPSFLNFFWSGILSQQWSKWPITGNWDCWDSCYSWFSCPVLTILCPGLNPFLI